jgi:glycosyltransferase involved in cell wall biosynthesis
LWTDEVMRRVAQRGHVVTCYSRAWKGLPSLTQVDGIDYPRISVSIDRWLRKAAGLIESRGLRNVRRPFYGSARCYRNFLSHLIRDLRSRGGADVIHVQTFSQFIPTLRCAFPSAKLVLHMHSEWLAFLDRRWIAPRIAAADVVIFCSEFFANLTRRAWPEHAHKFRVVYNGVRIEEFEQAAPTPITKHGPRLMFAGRISPDKGCHVLVEAFNRIVERYPSAELKLVGPDTVLPTSFTIDISDDPMVRRLSRFYDGTPYQTQLRRLASPAARPQMQITGAVPRDELVSLFRETDVYVMPSIYFEGFGIPIIEAGACKVPTVCSNRGGMPEVVIHNETGLIVPPDDAAALAGAILQLLDDEQLRGRMGAAAYRRVADNFTWDRIADSLLAEYQRLELPRELLLRGPARENSAHTATSPSA